jgi:hypothetical protein
MRGMSALVRRSTAGALATVVLLSSAAVTARAQPSSVCSQPRSSAFEDITEGTQYVFGQTFGSGDVDYTLRAFTWGDGRMTEEGFAQVDPPTALAGGSGLELEVNNVLLDLTFGGPLGSLTLRYGEYGGNVNVVVNGELQNVDSLPDLNGITIGGVDLSVREDVDSPVGTLSLVGRIESFAIGGQELWIDDVSGVLLCPNLVVAASSYRFEDAGRRLIVTVQVDNIGESPAEATVVSLAAEDWGTVRRSAGSLNAGDRTQVVLSAEVPAGQLGRTVSFVLRVDADGSVAETIEDDNDVAIQVIVPAPDMVISLGSIEVRRDVLVIAMTASNAGDVASRSTTVVSASEGWPPGTATVPRLLAGEAIDLTLEVPIPADRRGEMSAFVVTIDPDDVVRRELDETNNTAENSVDVPLATIDSSDTGHDAPWLPWLIVVIIAVVGAAVLWIRRYARKSPDVYPEPSPLELDVRPGEDTVRVTPRPDGVPRHTVRLIVRSNAANDGIRERAPR